MSLAADGLPPLHPRNKEFRWPSVKGGASFEEAGIGLTYLTAMQAEQFDRDGFVVLPGTFDLDLIRELAEAIDGHESDTLTVLR
jgi:hypothetical protein